MHAAAAATSPHPSTRAIIVPDRTLAAAHRDREGRSSRYHSGPIEPTATASGLRREALDDPGLDGPAALLESLAQHGPLPRPDTPARAELQLLIPVRLRLADVELRLFTTIATLGTPIDVTAQELRIETYYPADTTTESWLRDDSDTRRT